MKTRIIKQAHLSSECWNVQAFGLKYCEHCEYRNTKECGGQKIRKTGKNSKGFEVPLGRKK